MKIIIAGGRSFKDYELLKRELDEYLGIMPGDHSIISGCARGADSLGEQYAKENNLPLIKMPADWKTHGKSAGYIRNSDMAKIADAVVVFWDGKSKGTKHMIDIAKKLALKVKIVRF